MARCLGPLMTAIVSAWLVSAAAAGELDDIRRELRDGVPPALVNRQIAEAPLTFRGGPSAGAAVYRERVGSVVAIAVKEALGAGSLVSPLGDIVTNDHLLRSAHRANGAEWVLAWFKPDRHPQPARDQFLLARVLARDPQHDLALIRLVDPAPATATVMPLAPAPPEVGEEVFTIGHPRDYLWSLTQGIVSQIRPQYAWVGADGRSRSATAIQTQAPAGPGSSGAPLLDRRGAMVGVVFAAAPSARDLYLAIEVQHVREMLEKPGLSSGLRP